MAEVHVYVTPKAGVLDPQGAVVGKALENLGYAGVAEVRIGKFITLDVPNGPDIEARVDEMCKRLLANTVIEDYRFEVIGR
jgi:phosphoribosylformylglycinamidine synthase PurS subunit